MVYFKEQKRKLVKREAAQPKLTPVKTSVAEQVAAGRKFMRKHRAAFEGLSKR